MGFMTDKFKGVYRLKTPYDINKMDFPREHNGTFGQNDIYIDCQKGTQVFYYGKSQLEVYIPSVGRGHNIIKAIYSDNVQEFEKSPYCTITKNSKDEDVMSYDYESLYKDTELNKFIYDIYDTDEEVVFKFKWDKMKDFEKYLQPKTSGADRSPFSIKNLPKGDYEIPEEDITLYKEVTSKLPKEEALKLGHMTSAYLKTLYKSKKKQNEMKAEMKQKLLKNKEYIHYIGKWNDYLKYLEKEINMLCS